MTVSIVEFVEARLADDEATARAVQDNSAPFNGQWYNDEGHALRTANDWVLAYEHHGKTFAPGLLDHIARHDPARGLREIQAKRAVLDVYTLAHESHDVLGDGFVALDKAVRALAAIWSDHDEYRAEWAVA